jgi:hypothetical protein
MSYVQDAHDSVEEVVEKLEAARGSLHRCASKSCCAETQRLLKARGGASRSGGRIPGVDARSCNAGSRHDSGQKTMHVAANVHHVSSSPK